MSKSQVEKTIHIIPLKKVYFSRKKNRADRAIRLLKEYIARHFKDAEKIVIDPLLNAYIWSRSREKPPRKVVAEIRFNRESKEVHVLLVKSSKTTTQRKQ